MRKLTAFFLAAAFLLAGCATLKEKSPAAKAVDLMSEGKFEHFVTAK